MDLTLKCLIAQTSAGIRLNHVFQTNYKLKRLRALCAKMSFQGLALN